MAASQLRLTIDAAEVARLAALFRRVGPEIAAEAWRRGHVTMRRRLIASSVRMIAKRTSMRPKDVRDRVSVFGGDGSWRGDGGDFTLVIRSGWIPLSKLGAVRSFGPKGMPRDPDTGRFTAATRAGGVTVRGWGRHRGAFVATMGKTTTIWRRDGADRFPVKVLWGPNPAAAVLDDPAPYHTEMRRLVAEVLIPEIERQVGVLLG